MIIMYFPPQVIPMVHSIMDLKQLETTIHLDLIPNLLQNIVSSQTLAQYYFNL